MTNYILAIDQGTTSSRALLLDESANVCAMAQRTFKQYFPKNAWVEHDAEEIWQSVLSVCQEVIAQAGGAASIKAIGMTNQRETTLIWDRKTGKAIHRAIVWQDRRTAAHCQKLKSEGLEALVSEKAGLLLDPYFSASKIEWLLDHVEGAREKAEKGELAFGTIDSFLIWRLTEGRVHATDATNASRTSLMNLKTISWDDDLLKCFNVPKQLLGEIKDNCDNYGVTHLFGKAIPITGVAGDQHAACFGQACFEPGMVKSTYGTGCFMLLNTGENIVHSKHRLLTTVLSRIEGKTQYALEGSIFIAGAAVKWLHEELHLIKEPSETETLAEQLDSNQGVYMVPAFTGMGAPHWEPNARASIMGLTRDTDRRAIARAALECVCYQTRELLNVMRQDGADKIEELRVDGGMTDNAWFLSYLADCLNLDVLKPMYKETTAIGAGFMAGLQIGFFESLADIKSLWHQAGHYSPRANQLDRVSQTFKHWQSAVNLTLQFQTER